MIAFALARLRHAAVVLVVTATFAFTLAHLAPGDPIGATEDAQLTTVQRDALRARWGYDQPVSRQYLLWARNLATGDFGWSQAQHRPVSAVIRDALPNTLLLAVPALLLGLAIGIGLGTLQAAYNGRSLAGASNVATLALVSTPDYVVALLAFTVFAAKWRLAPGGGIVDPVNHNAMTLVGRMIDIANHFVLPGGTLALLIAASVSRYQRVAVLGVLGEDYVRTARAIGATERRVLWRHALRNALGPVVAIGGILIPGVLAGTVFIERVFSWPGIGLAVVEAVAARDYAVVQAVVLVGTVLVTTGVILSDVIGAVVNPRTRLRA